MIQQDVTIGKIDRNSQAELKKAMEKVFGARVQFEQSSVEPGLCYVVVPEIRQKSARVQMESFISGFTAALRPELAGAPGSWRAAE